MESSIGRLKKHIKDYNYLSLKPFPSSELKANLPESLIESANQAQFLLGKLSGITVLLPDVDFFINSYVLKDATSSAQIEGTKATLIEAFEYNADPTNIEDTDADDIAHYVHALNYALKRLKEDQFPFALRFIKEFHQVLMQGARSSHFADPGEFRKSQNWIGGTRPDNASFVPPSPEELNEALADLENFIHTPFVHPIIDAGFLHAQFETIHPFLDGNGRAGRLLITLYLIHRKYLELPVLFLSSFFKKHQKTYYERLNDYHNGQVLPWLEFFIEAVITTAEEAIEVSKKVTDLRQKDLSTVSKFNKKSSDTALKVIPKLYKEPIVSTVKIREWLGQSKPGTIKFIDKLIEVGILELFKKGEGTRPSLFIHKDYVKLFMDR